MSRRLYFLCTAFLFGAVVSRTVVAADPPAKELPIPSTVVVDESGREVILSAKIQFPEGKPCINEFGE